MLYTLLFGLSPLADIPPKADEIIVDGTRLEQSAVDSGTSITIVSRTDIVARGATFVADALGGVAGASINQTGAYGGFTSVRLRGAATGQTLTLIDGVPVGDAAAPSGGYDFATLGVDLVDRVEVLRGPQSVLWGSEAIGGVINIVSARPADGAAFRGLLEAGSFGTARANAQLSAASSRGYVLAGVSGFTSDGISKADERDGNAEADGVSVHAGHLSARADFSNGAAISATWRGSQSVTAFDGFPPPAFALADTDEETEAEEHSGAVRLFIPQADGRVMHEISSGFSSISRDNFDGNVPTFASDGQRRFVRYLGRAQFSPTLEVAGGLEQLESEANDVARAQKGAFALINLTHGRGSLELGTRLDDHDAFGRVQTSKVAAAFDLTSSLRLRAHWGEGFRAPSIFELTSTFGALPPNATLDPEEAVGQDIGLAWTSGGYPVSASIVWFEQHVTNQVDFSFETFRYENIAEANSVGVEVSAAWQPSQRTDIGLTYTNLEAKDGDGNDLARIPSHRAEVALGFAPTPKVAFDGFVTYNSAEQDAFGAVDAFTRVDLRVQYRPTERYRLFARLDNALDTDYQDVFGYGTPGRSAFVGVALGQ